MRLYFASGVREQPAPNAPYSDSGRIDTQQLEILRPILTVLARFPFSGTAYYVVKTLSGAIATSPRDVLLLGAEAIANGMRGGLASEPLAETDAREFVMQYVAQHRGLLQGDPDCLRSVMNIIDAFVDAGWPHWIDVIFELDSIYRAE